MRTQMGVQKCVNAHTHTGVSKLLNQDSTITSLSTACSGWIPETKTNEHYQLQFCPEQMTERHYRCSQEGSLDLVIWVTGGGVEQSPLVEKVF